MKTSEIEDALRAYFGPHDYSAEVHQVGNLVYITLDYEDFKPEHDVRNEIENMIPLSSVTITTRRYSDSAVNKALRMLINDDDARVVRGCNDVPALLYVEECLFNQDLSALC